MLKAFFLETNSTLAFANALEMSLGAIVFVMLLAYLAERTSGWRDFRGRMRKAFDPRFIGGPYDFLIACAVIFLGIVIRHETTWEWRVVSSALREEQLLLGSIVKAIGMTCFIRIISPPKLFNVIWPIALTSAVAFSWWSAQ